ncbi:MAG: hypothetical protein M0P27_10065, partial [Bacteroidales bacterium]|nr:hypothetical protein [Bacteroidales bacterium]
SYLPGTQLVSGYIVSSSGTTNLSVSRSYEPYRNLISSITNSWSFSVVSSFNYSNDSTGKRTKRIDNYNSSTVTNTFDYNIRDEVTNAVMNSDEHSIVYDDIGNREQSTVDSDQLSVTNSYTANNLNQYTSVSSGGSALAITHDSDGNMTWDGQKWHHTYDGENRLIFSKPDYWDTTNGACMFEYGYNYKNMRVEKVKKQLSGREVGYPMNPQADPGTWNPVETRKYVWDGWNIIAEITIDHVNSATNVSYYTWGLDLSGTLQGAGGVGGLLSDTKVLSSETNTYFAVGDANGNVTEYIDSIGATVAHGEHNAFGETKLSGSMKDQFTYWFSTKPFDPDTGFVVYQRRYYEPILCLWLSRDPIGIKGGLNEVRFIDNNAVNAIDKYGLWKHQHNCTAKQQKDLRAAESTVIAHINNWNTYLTDVASGQYFLTYIENHSSSQRALLNWRVFDSFSSTLKIKLETLKNAINNNSYGVECECKCKENKIAYILPLAVFWGLDDDLHFCPLFFKQSKNEQAAFFIHELSHFKLNTKDDYGWLGPVAEMKESLGIAQLYENVGRHGAKSGNIDSLYKLWLKGAFSTSY